MSKDTEGLTPDEIAAREAKQAKMLRWGIVGLAVLLLGGFAFAVLKDQQEESVSESWDQYAQIRTKYEPANYQWNNPRGVYTDQREKYHDILTRFLAKEAGEWDDALEPQVRWRLAKSLADHVLSNKDVLDAAKRTPWYDQAIEQMQIVRDKFNEFPLNWSRLHKDPSTPTLTVQFIRWLEGNRKWEQEHLPTAKEPDGAHTIVLRTNRGDMRFRLFEADAPDWTAAFVKRVADGHYDGTSIFGKKDVGTDTEPEQHFVRGGAQTSRDPKPYDRDDALRLEGEFQGGGVMPEEARNRIIHVAGTLVAWHERGEEYDDESQFLIVARRSPILDYQYTPVGKVVDDASRETLDRIYSGSTWNDDPETVDGSTTRYQDVLDVLQVPAVIVKALAYKDGALVKPAGEPAATKVATASDESSLSSLKPDAYKKDVPQRPQVEDAKDKEADDKEDNAPKDDAESEASGGMTDEEKAQDDG